MKTSKNLYSKMLNLDYIKNVIKESLKGKKYKDRMMKKIDSYSLYALSCMETFSINLKETKKEIIHDRKKDRVITISPYFPNKIFDYLIVSAIKPIIEKSMFKWCVGNIEGKGKDMGISYIEKHIKKYKYALKLDVKKFYDNVDKKILYELIKRKISDEKFLKFYSLVVGKDGKGIDLGLNSSQWLANYYLQGLDYFIKQNLRAEIYVRYVDDMIILGNNKRKLNNFIKKIEEYLEVKLNLTLKENYQLLNLEKGDDIEFLGYKISKKQTRLCKPLFHKFVRLYKRMNDKSKKRAKTIVSLFGWFKRTSYSYMYYMKYLQPIIQFSTIKKLLKKRSV